MISGVKLIDPPNPLRLCYSQEIKSSALTLVSSSLLFWQRQQDLSKKEPSMAQPHTRPQSRNDTELWFSMSSNTRREQQWVFDPEQSAYQATSSRHNVCRSVSPSRFPPIPSISTTAALNKPLPLSPESEKKRRKSLSFRNLVRRRPSGSLDSSYLQPEPQPQHRRLSAGNDTLSADSSQYTYHHQPSRSMPSSPGLPAQSSSHAATLARAHSAAANFSEPGSYMAYQHVPQPQQPYVSPVDTFFEPQPPRARRTFPDSMTPSSATPWDSPSNRPRPRTWLSAGAAPGTPEDATDFHLFAEATSGFSGASLDFGALSPTSPPALQGSLFSRTHQNDRIPIPLQHSAPRQTPRIEPVTVWQTMGANYVPFEPPRTMPYPMVSSSALPQRASYQQDHLNPHMHDINMELERLGLSDDGEPDDELPDYAQSQAEMASKRQKEAAARARELEARWNDSRSWRSR
ncbi:hypothetical protein K491DRAFT_16074 [Lophiostoma macrostomum CBS 122681]|uniref:Uncharacterized protein n=1 Tax=Lophiostoma macrostomum CBS 122681 TaxID=1314788 RepID=A0A6A6TL61_9PLEO|nr:hypothetical protein K491DRAFT_16074 [Lophiostoma macrostomum CBS 122681]